MCGVHGDHPRVAQHGRQARRTLLAEQRQLAHSEGEQVLEQQLLLRSCLLAVASALRDLQANIAENKVLQDIQCAASTAPKAGPEGTIISITKTIILSKENGAQHCNESLVVSKNILHRQRGCHPPFT